ncbi:Por secretion system C-terminal sorting domain-containing protein [Aquimarina amphilecti]|uniref:Por secretion system C-terminal sorting domain-containing protein n=1 Tax=Aquimarina amphilecti TaxID=1038014 RepID=A0A1H7X8N3_AQUAM|nr:PKD domain-containing protein [Aquimarina amphilecti]SEM29429.1 Por secretion system C-terminal sorting domain-containing protein [Aquimarina amphilecti]
MTKIYLKNLILFLFTISTFIISAQENSQQLIAKNADDLIENLTANKSKGFSIYLNKKNSSLSLTTKIEKTQNDQTTYIGSINNEKLSTFALFKTKNQIEGTLVLRNKKTGYKIFTNDLGKVYIKEVDINSLVCIDFEATKEENQLNKNDTSSRMPPQLESLPGAPGIIYLDFDGEVVSGTRWVNGGTINAVSPNFSDQKITDVWKIMAEDFRAFNLNVTTRRDLYDAAPQNKRMMCIFTPTNDAAPGSGGVAYLGSFSSTRTDDPCWIYNLSTRAAGETGSHEVGHTLRLGHDGRPGEEYYAGHGQWSPIMGWSASKPIGHWSMGEYDDAVQQQDDIEIIAGSQNGIGFREDDHKDVLAEATPILVDTDGNVSSSQNYGFIHNRNDKDIFSFVIETGNVSFNFNPNPDHPNLNIQARILNGIGEEIAASDPSGLSANIDLDLTFGTYFIEIDGVGEGNLSNGYSDYSSIGNYYISGKYIPGDNNQPPIANFEAATNCSTVNFNSTTINNVSAYTWDFGDGNTSTEQNPTHTYINSGTYTVSLTTANSAGEDTRQRGDFIVINIPQQPVGQDQSICIGESASLTVTGNSEFEWYDTPTGGNPLYTGTTFEATALQTSQTYYVSGSFDNCTTNTRTVINVIVEENPQPPTIEIPDTKNLTVDSAYSQYQWYFNGAIITGANDSQYTPDQIGEYSVEVFNETGCNAISSVFSVDLSQLNLSQGSSVFNFYPNPTIDILKIDGLTINERDIRIVNTSGQVVINTIIQPEVDLTKLSSGLYILLINNKSVGKFVKL